MDTIIKEADRAEAKYGHFNSTHELYGVLKEEVDEFWDEVKFNSEEYSGLIRAEHKENMIHELTQIAAIAYRGIKELENNQIKYV